MGFFLMIGKYPNIREWIVSWFDGSGLDGNWDGVLGWAISLAILIFLCWVLYFVVRLIIRLIVRSWAKRSANENIAIFREKKTFETLALLFPGILVYNALPVFFVIGANADRIIKVLVGIFIIIVILNAISRLLHALEYLGMRSEKFKRKPVSSYVQVVLILAYIFCSILILSILVGQSVMMTLTAFGAGMAIFLLIFKDLILGLVASVQVSTNDMVRVGDWISVPQFNADGEVLEINLSSVKVRNWDKSVSNVPTYALVSNGFKNVREMQDQGMRRFLHHLYIDIRSIKEVDADFVNSLKESGLFDGDVKDLTWTGEDDYAFEKTVKVTNIGLFRRYIEAFMMRHPGINPVYMVVRQLQQDGNGLPLEVYAFVKSVSFKPLNLIMSDVFEHLFCIIDSFDLQLYQHPAGEDIKRIKTLPDGGSIQKTV